MIKKINSAQKMFRYFLIILPFLIFSCSSNVQRPAQNYPPVYPYQNQYYQPNSRFYNNPYVLPQQYASPYYDIDQYYVPPNNYYNIERPQNSGSNNKF